MDSYDAPSRSNTGTSRRSFVAGLGASSITGIGLLADTTGIGSAKASVWRADGSVSESNVLESFVDSVLDRRIGTTVPGATVAIVRRDAPILVKGYGVADVDTEAPVRAAETAFRIGSVGKLVTWTAVMQGVEEGWLELDADVNIYLENSEVSVPKTYDAPITLGHLGTHTAGYESALDPRIVTSPAALEPLETVLAEDPPPRIRPPGQLVGYSNYGAALAGHVVAEASGTPFGEYMRSNIFAPLEMAHSTFEQPVADDHPGTLAAGHAREDDSLSRANTVYINMYPAGSMSATAADIARFMRAHLGDGSVSGSRLLRLETLRSMHECHHVRHPAVTNWRYGFHEYGHPDANLLSHSGATINFTSRLLLNLDHDIGIFVNYNINNAAEPPADVVDEILDEFNLQPAPSTPAPTRESGANDRAETVAGEYRASYLPESGPLQIADILSRVTVESTAPGRLVTESLEGDARKWIETEPFVYQEVGGRDRLAFEINNGEVEAMYMNSEPTGAHLPVPRHEQQLVTGGVLGTSLAGFGVSLAGWTANGTYRRVRGRRSESNGSGGTDD